MISVQQCACQVYKVSSISIWSYTGFSPCQTALGTVVISSSKFCQEPLYSLKAFDQKFRNSSDSKNKQTNGCSRLSTQYDFANKILTLPTKRILTRENTQELHNFWQVYNNMTMNNPHALARELWSLSLISNTVSLPLQVKQSKCCISLAQLSQVPSFHWLDWVKFHHFIGSTESSSITSLVPLSQVPSLHWLDWVKFHHFAGSTESSSITSLAPLSQVQSLQWLDPSQVCHFISAHLYLLCKWLEKSWTGPKASPRDQLIWEQLCRRTAGGSP